MATVSVYNMEGKEVGTMDLNDAVFGVEVNEHLVHMAVVAQLPKYPAAEESPGDKKEPVMQDRVQQELPNGRAAEWYSLPRREITPFV